MPINFLSTEAREVIVGVNCPQSSVGKAKFFTEMPFLFKCNFQFYPSQISSA